MPAYDIRERAFDFSCDIGANLEEADVAHSKPDFVAKNSIALKEARETRYWLRLIRSCKLAPEERVEPHLREATELVLILAAIRRNARRSEAQSQPNHPLRTKDG